MSKKTTALLQALLENKKDYIEHLNDLLTESLVVKLQRVYQDSLQNSEVRSKGILVVFQEQLAQIIHWNATKVALEYEDLMETTKCGYLHDLFNAAIVCHVKINLLANQKSIDSVRLKLPAPEDFVHKALVYVARSVWKKPYLFYHKARSIERQQYMNELEAIIHKALQATIRSFMPILEIIQDKIKEDDSEETESEEESDSETEEESEDDEQLQSVAEESESEESESESEDEQQIQSASEEEESDSEDEQIQSEEDKSESENEQTELISESVDEITLENCIEEPDAENEITLGLIVEKSEPDAENEIVSSDDEDVPRIIDTDVAMITESQEDDVANQKHIVINEDDDTSSIDSHDPVLKVDVIEQTSVDENEKVEAVTHVPYGSMLINRRVFHEPKLKVKKKTKDAFF